MAGGAMVRVAYVESMVGSDGQRGGGFRYRTTINESIAYPRSAQGTGSNQGPAN